MDIMDVLSTVERTRIALQCRSCDDSRQEST